MDLFTFADYFRDVGTVLCSTSNDGNGVSSASIRGFSNGKFGGGFYNSCMDLFDDCCFDGCVRATLF